MITSGELIYGALNKNELRRICKRLESVIVIPLNEEISERTIELMTNYSLSHKLALHDALIAATCLVYDLPLFTFNLKDFRFIKGLKLHKPF